MTEEKEKLSQEAEDSLMKKRMKGTRETGLICAAALIIAGVIIGAFSLGQMATTSGTTPDEMKYSGILNETAYQEVNDMYNHDAALSTLSFGMGVVLGGMFVFIVVPDKKSLARIDELLKPKG
jgi:hypothetical protein